MLVSNTGLKSGSGVLSYHADTGEFIGSLDDPSQDSKKLVYDIRRQYDQPKGLAVDSDGQIYVAYRCSSCDNPQKSAIVKFSMDSDGRMPTQRFAFGPGKEEGFEGLAISPDSQYLFVSQSESGRVIGYSAQRGAPQTNRTFTNFFHPRGLAFDSMGALYVLSGDKSFRGAGKISVVDKGAKAYLLVKPDPDSPLLLDDFSAGLTFGPMGDLFVVSTGRDKVLRYRILRRSKVPVAKFVGEFADPEKNGCLDPAGLAFGPHDQNLYVTCRTSNNIVRYNGRTGKFIDEFVPGKNSKRFYKRFYKSRLNNPVYITFKSYDSPFPIRLKKPYNNVKIYPITVFRWEPSKNPAVVSYRLIIATDSQMKKVIFYKEITRGKKHQVALNLRKEGLHKDQLYWVQALAINRFGMTIESTPPKKILCSWNQDVCTLIKGIVMCDVTHQKLVNAHVAVSTERHRQTNDSDADTSQDGEYDITALIKDWSGQDISFPIEITAISEGYQRRIVRFEESDIQEEEITHDFLMKRITLPSIPLLLLKD
jgi:sugar lactone lactonase YvrE